MTALGPRLVVAGTHSGVGKTTLATGLMAALLRHGVSVASGKVGPDFIDPGYHALATGTPGVTLDPWMCGEDVIAPLAARGAHDGRVLIVEGVMGLFDGASDDGVTASTAHVARLLDAPVLLVVDGSGMSGSVAALVHGFATFEPATRIAGVILNRVRGDRHELLLREALDRFDIPVVGALPRRDDLVWRDRHLGLVPVVEHVDAARRSVEHLGQVVAGACDLDAVRRIAEAAPRRVVGPAPSAQPVAEARVGVARGPAFDFVYPENLELLEDAGADLAPFDPLIDHALPEGIDAVYVGGGFPEVFAAALGDNRPLLDDVRTRVHAGLVTWAECGGYLWLCASLDGVAMAGALPATATMTDRVTVGYRTATPTIDTPVAVAGSELLGHEFHYSTVDPPGVALEMDARFQRGRAGFGSQSLLASYLHLHLAGAPHVAERFVRCAASSRATARRQ